MWLSSAVSFWREAILVVLGVAVIYLWFTRPRKYKDFDLLVYRSRQQMRHLHEQQRKLFKDMDRIIKEVGQLYEEHHPHTMKGGVS